MSPLCCDLQQIASSRHKARLAGQHGELSYATADRPELLRGRGAPGSCVSPPGYRSVTGSQQARQLVGLCALLQRAGGNPIPAHTAPSLLVSPTGWFFFFLASCINLRYNLPQQSNTFTLRQLQQRFPLSQATAFQGLHKTHTSFSVPTIP